jgi:hypothetical protein
VEEQIAAGLPAAHETSRALIAGTYLSGTNTRRVRHALSAVFKGAVGKDVVSRTWRKLKGDWDASNARSLKDEPIIHLILDGTIVRVRLDKKATSISLSWRWACGKMARRCGGQEHGRRSTTCQIKS